MTGRSVLITGGGGGLGGAVTDAFVDAGWRVVAPVRAKDPAGKPGVVTLTADLADPGSVAEVVAVATAEPAEPLRAVVNLVGGYGGGALIHETPYDEFARMLEVNLRPTYLVTAAALPHLVEHQGAVVCVAARAAVAPFPRAAGYVTAKAGVIAFANAVAVEYKAQGVRSNTVLPSVIDTPANRASQPDADYSRWVPPAQIASVIRLLASDESAATSGAIVPVYGRA